MWVVQATSVMSKFSLPPNQRLQLTLPPFGERPLAVLRGGLVDDGERLLTSFVPLTPALLRGAAETHNR
jgi:hypothetical protein